MKYGYTLMYVKDVDKTLAFYEAAFGLARKFYNQEMNQEYGELETGETTIGFVSYGLASAQGIVFAKASAESSPPAMDIGFVVADVKTAYARAIDHGCLPVAAPEQKPWGQVVSYVRDTNGFLISINSEIKPDA